MMSRLIWSSEWRYSWYGQSGTRWPLNFLCKIVKGVPNFRIPQGHTQKTENWPLRKRNLNRIRSGVLQGLEWPDLRTRDVHEIKWCVDGGTASVESVC